MTPNHSTTFPAAIFEQTYRECAAIFNGTARENFTPEEENAFDRLFADQVRVSVGDFHQQQQLVPKSTLKVLFQGRLQEGRHCKICEWKQLSNRVIQYRVEVTAANGELIKLEDSVVGVDAEGRMTVIEPYVSSEDNERIVDAMMVDSVQVV